MTSLDNDTKHCDAEEHDELQEEEDPHISPITNDDEERKPFLILHNQPIYFQEDWNVGIGGGLWSTGLALAKYFGTDHALEAFRNHLVMILPQAHQPRDSNTSDDESNMTVSPRRPLCVLELGSGNGLLSTCWLALWSKLVSSSSSFSSSSMIPSCQLVVTDTYEHVELIQRTLSENSHLIISRDNSCHVHVLEHRWGDTSDALSSTTTTADGSSSNLFDIILGSDLAYRNELHDPLIASLAQFSSHQTRTYLGVTMADTSPAFFHKLTTAGFEYRKLSDRLLEPEFQGLTFGVFVIQRHDVSVYSRRGGAVVELA